MFVQELCELLVQELHVVLGQELCKQLVQELHETFMQGLHEVLMQELHCSSTLCSSCSCSTRSAPPCHPALVGDGRRALGMLCCVARCVQWLSPALVTWLLSPRPSWGATRSPLHLLHMRGSPELSPGRTAMSCPLYTLSAYLSVCPSVCLWSLPLGGAHAGLLHPCPALHSHHSAHCFLSHMPVPIAI